jgi:hypothetical protein
LKPRLPPVRISYEEMPFESRSSDKPGVLAGDVVEVDTRFPRTKLSPQASNTVSTYLCYIVHKTIKQESIREEEEEEEEEEYDIDGDALRYHSHVAGSVSPGGYRTKREQIGDRVGNSLRGAVRAMIRSKNGPGHMEVRICNDKVSVFFCFFFCSLRNSSSSSSPPPLYGGDAMRILIGTTLMLIVD